VKVKINLEVGYLLVVYYEECDFKMFVFVLFLLINVFQPILNTIHMHNGVF